MNWTSIERSWNHYKTYAKDRWNRLSDQQIEATMGNHEQLSRCVQQAYGLSKPEADRRIAVWFQRQAGNPPLAANA